MPPADDHVVVHEPLADGARAAGDRSRWVADRDALEGVRHRRVVAGVRRSEPSPTPNVAVCQQRAALLVRRDDGRNGARQPWLGTSRRRKPPDLPRAIVAPTLDSASIEQGARVSSPDRHPLSPVPSPEPAP